MVSAEKYRILLIDSDPGALDFLSRTLSAREFQVVTAPTGRQALAHLSEEAFNLVLIELNLPDRAGIEMAQTVTRHYPGTGVIAITAYSSVDSAVQAMKAGALDYLTKPLDPNHLERVLKRAMETRRRETRRRPRHSPEPPASTSHTDGFEDLVGASSAMQRIYTLIHQLAGSDTTVLLQGETGTGKELVARAIHNRSGRTGRLIPINCGALPDSILESELFGHEKGAFTGAVRQKYGLIEQAEGGTLFLDEIEEMSPALQVKLLRAIQEREVLRVGGSRPVSVNFRLIAAANTNLRDRMEQGRFRTDLFYRLSVMVMDLPPLRQRREDIPLLIEHFLRALSKNKHRAAPAVSPEAMTLLRTHPWPGNVRELKNAIEQAFLLNSGDIIHTHHLPDHIVLDSPRNASTLPSDLPLREAREEFERQYIEAILKRTGGNISEAARQAGINRQHFYAKMNRYGISRPE